MQQVWRGMRGLGSFARFEVALSIGLLGVLGLDFFGVLPRFELTTGLMLAALLGTAPVVYGALANLYKGEWVSMEMLAAIALALSLSTAEWTSAVFIALMLSGSRLLSLITEARANASIESLLSLRPDHARVERAGVVEQIPLGEVRVGDIVIIDTGDRVPVDGSIVRGEGSFDESSLTGESLPVDKGLEDAVYSGALLTAGGVRIRATKVGKDTTLEKIIRLVETSVAHRSRIVTLGERFGRAYLVSMIIAAGVLLVATGQTSLVLAFVLVVCADDIAIAVPLAFLGAIGTAAKQGIIVKGGSHLEALAGAWTYIFDKTGTLTTGALAVTEVYALAPCTEAECVRVAAIAARGSMHPLSRAIVAHAPEEPLAFPELSRSLGGKGVVAEYRGDTILLGKETFVHGEGAVIPHELVKAIERMNAAGNSVSLVAKNGVVLGALALRDTLKPEARATLATLRTLGAEQLIMLTGDHERVAHTVAAELGIDTCYAGLLPEEKVARVRALAAAGPVVMVGDGINDAAALASATVGVAMGGIGHDVTIESADIVLMTDDLEKLVTLVQIARVTKRIAVQDFWIWGATNGLGMALVFGGVIGPAGAAAYNFISDFLPLGNSLRAWSAKTSRYGTPLA